MQESLWRVGLSVAGDSATVAATCLAFWVYFRNRGKISDVFSALLQIRSSQTASDLRRKIDALANAPRITDEKQRDEVVHILADLYGFLEANEEARTAFKPVLRSLKQYLDVPIELTEVEKRRLASRVTELLKKYEFEQFTKRDLKNE